MLVGTSTKIYVYDEEAARSSAHVQPSLERSWELGTFRGKKIHSRNGQTCFQLGCNCRARNSNTTGTSQPKEDRGISSYSDKFAFIEMVQPPRPRIIIGLLYGRRLQQERNSREVVEWTLVWQVRLVINLSTEGFLGLPIPNKTYGFRG